MEQENQKANTANEQNTTTQNFASQTAATADTSTDGGDQTFERLMAESPTLSPFCGWLKCLRKPALSMEYSIQKRHVPDLDTDSGTSGQSAPKAQKGQNSDTMGLSGSFTIRYFDFALGVLGLAIAGCFMKGCGCLKRKMF